MYHIKEDKRAQKSAELIYEGLSALMEKKEYDRITITDIQEASTVGRATFYRNFDNVADVLYWQCDIHYKECMTGYLEQTGNMDDPYHFLKYFFDYWIKEGNSKILEQIISIGHYDIIFSCHFNSSKILNVIDPTKPGNNTEFYKYYMSGLIGAFVGFLITWISNGKTLTSDELIEMMMAYGDDNAMRFFM